MKKKIKIGDICDILNGFAFKSDKYVSSGIRVIRITNVQKGYLEDSTPQYYPLETISELEKYMLNEGDLLMSLTGNVGRVALLTANMLPAALNQRVACLRIKDSRIIDKGFLFQFLNSDYFELQCILSSKGIAQKNMSTEWLKEYEIPIFTKEEQKQISLELSKVDFLITARHEQLAKLDELVKARFVELFGDPVLNPKKWTVSELSAHIQFLTSGSRGWSQYFTDSGEYFITIKNVKNCRITLDDVQYVVPPDNAEAKRTRVQEGDLLISITADLGRTGVITKEIADYGGYINQHLICIRLNQDAVRPLYVAYYMESEAGKSQFQAKNQSAVKAGLNFNSINSLRLIVPPIELQDKFISFVEQTDKSKLAIQKSLEKLETLKKALIQKYFG